MNGSRGRLDESVCPAVRTSAGIICIRRVSIHLRLLQHCIATPSFLGGNLFFRNEREKIVKPVSAFCRYCLNLHTQKLCYRLLYSTNVCFDWVGLVGRLVGMALCLASVRSGRKTEIEKVNKNLFFGNMPPPQSPLLLLLSTLAAKNCSKFQRR